MKRGDLVTVALPGDYGKPRPALVVQADRFESMESITVLPLTSEMMDAKDTRIAITPNSENGLRQPSSVMIDKIGTLPQVKAGPVFGRLSDDDMAAVNRALAIFLGFV